MILQLLQNPIIQSILGIAGTGLSIYMINNVGAYILRSYYPKILIFLLKYIKNLDDNYLDKFKEQYNELGLEIEDQLADTLRKIANVIQDKD